MKFGIFDHVDKGASDLHGFYEDRLKIAEKYDEVGFYAYHVAEHHATTLGMASSPNVYLSAIAQRTQKLRFGPLVYCLPQYHPVRLYEEICMLDNMSRGRLEIGLGKGISNIESSYFGINSNDVTAIYREIFDILAEAWNAKELTYEGKHFTINKLPLEMKPMQAPHPPLWMGVAKPNLLSWPAKHKINIISNNVVSVVREITDDYRSKWMEFGREPDAIPYMGMTRFVVIASTNECALRIGRRAYSVWYQSFMKLWNRYGETPPLAAYTDDFDDLVLSGLAIVGKPEVVKKLVDEQIDQSGVNYFSSRFLFGDISYSEAIYAIDAFSEMFFHR